MCGTRGDRIVMCIPNNCVREQYFGFLREYYQQRKEVFLPHLKDLIDDMAFDGQWRPLFEYIALAYKENSAIRDASRENTICKVSSKHTLLLLLIIWFSRNWR